MIRKLQKRMTLLVTAVILLVTGGIVAAISVANYKGIEQQMQSALTTLLRAEEQKPIIRGRKAADEEDGTGDPEDGRRRFLMEMLRRENQGDRTMPRRRGQPADTGTEPASLANTYSILADQTGSVISWSSDRAELYTDEQIQELTDEVLRSGRMKGRIGTQFFQKVKQEESSRIIVADARLEMASAARMLVITTIVGAVAGLLLSTGAFFLIRRMIRPVEEAFLRQRQFVWDASHELKTPLAVISANAQVLQDEIGENESLGYIRGETQRAAALVGNLLTLARMDQGNVQAKLSSFDLSRAAEGAVLPFESTAYEAGRRMETEFPENVMAVGDEAMTRQLLLILMDNALKYGDDREPICVRVIRGQKQHTLEVSNSGETLAPEVLQHIFDRFYRGDAAHSREKDGTGLGLAIAKSIVEAQNGSIHAESQNQRTTFRVTLPAVMK